MKSKKSYYQNPKQKKFPCLGEVERERDKYQSPKYSKNHQKKRKIGKSEINDVKKRVFIKRENIQKNNKIVKNPKKI